MNYETSEVLVTVGVGEATYASMAAFLEEGDEVLVPNPVWLNYIHVPSSLGATPVTYSLKEENDYQIDFEELESSFCKTDTFSYPVILLIYEFFNLIAFINL